jgi:sugar lactone lactonase YvrE
MSAHIVQTARTAVLLAILALTSCGGGNGGGSPNPVTLGGSVSGLAGSGLVLVNNGSDQLAVSGDGPFTFATRIPPGGAYSVNVLTQPTGPSQACTVVNGTGHVANVNVSGVTVACTTNTYSVSGNVTGLAGLGLVLVNNGVDALTVSADGVFTFAAPVPSGSTYSTTVQTQPTSPTQICSVDHGGGTVGATTVTTIAVRCTCTLTPCLSAVAGHFGGIGHDDGVGTAARFDHPAGTATDAAGNIYVADTDNNTIRKITTAGVATTLAGTAGVTGSTDGSGTAAAFSSPTGIATGPTGDVYVADSGNSTIRKITPAGVVTTLAGVAGVRGSADGSGAWATFSGPGGVATDTAGNLYVADAGNNTIRKITPAGVVTTLAGMPGVEGSADGTGAAAQFSGPWGIATDVVGNVYVGDTGNCMIRKISPAGGVSTLAGTNNSYITPPSKVDPGQLIPCSGSADGVGSAAQFTNPTGVAADSVGYIYVADSGNNRIRKITPAGVVTTLAGSSFGSSDGTGSAANFNYPTGISVGSAGTVYVGDWGNSTVRAVTPNGVVTTLAGLAMVLGKADGFGTAASFQSPWGVAADSSGNVYVADNGGGYGSTIRKITTAGVVSTLAGTSGVRGSSDGAGAAARFYALEGIATDAAGNIYAADSINNTIRKITPAGIVTTLAGTALNQGSADGTGAAAQFFDPCGVATDAAANIYVTDTSNDTVRKVTPAGIVTTLAGHPGTAGEADGIGTAALFTNPCGIAVGATGDIFVADGNHAIRRITPAGVVTTIAGTAEPDASPVSPFGLVTDAAGDVYVADTGRSRIRKIAPDGTISTLAGVADLQGFTPGPLPGVIGPPRGIAISGTSLYITMFNGVAVVHDAP